MVKELFDTMLFIGKNIYMKFYRKLVQCCLLYEVLTSLVNRDDNGMVSGCVTSHQSRTKLWILTKVDRSHILNLEKEHI